jgi:hypothetical protein
MEEIEEIKSKPFSYLLMPSIFILVVPELDYRYSTGYVWFGVFLAAAIAKFVYPEGGRKVETWWILMIPMLLIQWMSDGLAMPCICLGGIWYMTLRENPDI